MVKIKKHRNRYQYSKKRSRVLNQTLSEQMIHLRIRKKLMKKKKARKKNNTNETSKFFQQAKNLMSPRRRHSYQSLNSKITMLQRKATQIVKYRKPLSNFR